MSKTEEGVSGHVVVMQQPVAVAQQLWSFFFSSHSFPQAHHNVTVKVIINRTAENKFSVKNVLYVEKTMSMLFVPSWTCLVSLGLGEC